MKRLPLSKCWSCNALANAASNLEDGSAVPIPGDVTVCLECASINIFDEKLELRKPTEEEMKIADELPEVKEAMQFVVRYWQKKLQNLS